MPLTHAAALDFDCVEAGRRLDSDEFRDGITPHESVNVVIKGKIGQAIGVVGEETILAHVGEQRIEGLHPSELGLLEKAFA